MNAIRHSVMARTPKSADDQCAVYIDFQVSSSSEYMSVSRFFSIAAARELALSIERAADEAEAKLDQK